VLVTGAVSVAGDRITVKFRAYDVFNGQVLEGAALQFAGTTQGWRRMAHKVADVVYSKITGEGGYFDSRVVFVSEIGSEEPAAQAAGGDGLRRGERCLSDRQRIHRAGAALFAPGDRILYTSYETGFPRITLLDVGSLRAADPGRTARHDDLRAPVFSPTASTVVFSLERGGNTDIYTLNLASGGLTQLTNAPSIETAPSFSPDGSQIVFESDRTGVPQIYVMPASGGEGTRISGGQGRYGTPVWSPRGDLIAFTKQNAGRFHIGVMRTDGSEERLLTASFLDEGPTWAPNGRVLMFTRETAGRRRADEPLVGGYHRAEPQADPDRRPGKDPAWSPLLP
jgi:TolB protein